MSTATTLTKAIKPVCQDCAEGAHSQLFNAQNCGCPCHGYNDTGRVVPRWEFKTDETVLVRIGSQVKTGRVTLLDCVAYEDADGFREYLELDGPECIRVVPATTAGIHELKRQLSCLEGEIAATRDQLDAMYVTFADAEGL